MPDVGDHIHDRAAVRPHPFGVDLAHDDEATGQVVAYHCLKTLGGDGFQGCAVLAAGVVEQPVDAPVFVEDRVDDATYRAVVANLGLHRVEFVGTAAHDGHLGPECGEFVGGASSDAATSAGNHDCLAS